MYRDHHQMDAWRMPKGSIPPELLQNRPRYVVDPTSGTNNDAPPREPKANRNAHVHTGSQSDRGGRGRRSSGCRQLYNQHSSGTELLFDVRKWLAAFGGFRWVG